MSMNRKYELSPKIEAFIRAQLEERGRKLDHFKELAIAALNISDFFISNPEDFTPWHEPWGPTGYLAYFLPLNELRARAVIDQGNEVGFFEGLEHAIDFGAGPGTASLAFEESKPMKSYAFVERAPQARELIAKYGFPQAQITEDLNAVKITDPAKTLFVASYSLTETALPETAKQCEALMILEPATHDDGQALLDLRARLLAEGFHAWAPCPHQLRCPLHETRDWCHDRIHVEHKPWQRKIESLLPVKNPTLTYSYLLARKTPPPKPGWARLIGDSLKENGKTRQLVCRGPEREFLAWMKRHKNEQTLPRGVRVEIPETLEKKSNEIRVGENQIHVLSKA